MKKQLLKVLSNPQEFFYKSGYGTPKNGYISEEARLKARKKRKKKKK